MTYVKKKRDLLCSAPSQGSEASKLANNPTAAEELVL